MYELNSLLPFFINRISLVKSALELGFEVSSLDGGYLLFQSWNASAKVCSWSSSCWNGPSTAVTIKKQEVVERLIGLRDDICEVWQLFNRNNVQSQQSLLERTTLSKRGLCRPSEALISGITSAEQVIKRVVSELNATAESPTLPVFTYFEAMPIYISFLASMHTKPGSSNFSAIHRFSKSPYPNRTKPVHAYTDEDVIDEPQSSDESDFDSFESGGHSLKARALSRLHNSCVSLGAAPCWPDWLDTSCQMQKDIAASVAVDSADSAILSLTSFGVAVYMRYCHAKQVALGIAHRCKSEEPPIPTTLVHSLLASQQQLSRSEHESFYSYLSLLSKTEVSTLKALVNDYDSLPNNKLAAHSAQRIQGADVTVIKDPTIAEMRANEQWEIVSCRCDLLIYRLHLYLRPFASWLLTDSRGKFERFITGKQHYIYRQSCIEESSRRS